MASTWPGHVCKAHYRSYQVQFINLSVELLICTFGVWTHVTYATRQAHSLKLWLDYALTCGFNLARKSLPAARFHMQRSLRRRREAWSAPSLLKKLPNNSLISVAFLESYEKYHANIYIL